MSTTTRTRPTKHISDLHFDHVEWLNALSFYREDIGILEHRLEDIVRRNTKPEVLAELEHFQNQFIREREVIDELRHDIKQHENMLERESKEHPIAIDHRLYVDHTGLRERMATYEKLFRELKSDYHRWLAERL